jgi:hypothetical protein
LDRALLSKSENSSMRAMFGILSHFLRISHAVYYPQPIRIFGSSFRGRVIFSNATYTRYVLFEKDNVAVYNYTIVAQTKFEAKQSELVVPNTNLGSFRQKSTNVESKKSPLYSPIPWMTCLEID